MKSDNVLGNVYAETSKIPKRSQTYKHHCIQVLACLYRYLICDLNLDNKEFVTEKNLQFCYSSFIPV